MQSRISEPGVWSVFGICGCCVADPVSGVQANLRVHLSVHYGGNLLKVINDWL
jgi:hypothetical protein